MKRLYQIITEHPTALWTVQTCTPGLNKPGSRTEPITRECPTFEPDRSPAGEARQAQTDKDFVQSLRRGK
jgi:hypothetical protein